MNKEEIEKIIELEKRIKQEWLENHINNGDINDTTLQEN